jgi:hypothetical protein
MGDPSPLRASLGFFPSVSSDPRWIRASQAGIETGGPSRNESGAPLLDEVLDRIDDGLAIAAQGDSDFGRVFATGTGQQDLAAAQNESLWGAQAGLQLLALRRGEFTDEERWLIPPVTHIAGCLV